VDGDGNLDLLITGDGTATLYLGDGNGGFTEAGAGLTGVERGSSSIGDVNNDGNLDLLITGEDANFNRTATVYLGDGTGEFTEQDAGLTGVFGGSSTFRDVDNDGNLDLLITGKDADNNPTATLYENLASGNFLEETAVQTVTSDGTVEFGSTGASVQFEGTSGSGDVTVQRFSNGPSNPSGIGEPNISSYRFAFSAAGDLTFSDNTEVRLDVSTLSGISDASNVTVYKRPVRGDGEFTSLPTSYDAGNDELVAETVSFSEFVLASDESDNPLPVELASFNGTATESGARLTWQTASETNNAGFEVQRQKEEGWTQIGFVDSKAAGGTTTETQSYSYTARDLPVGTHQFRLRQVDLDGSSTLTDPVTVDIRMQEALKLTAPAPNPASNSARLSFAVREQAETTIRLYNTLGQQVATVYDGTPQAGEQQRAQLDVTGLSSGTYFLRLHAGGHTTTRQMTVVR
jgi:hypothetical protein